MGCCQSCNDICFNTDRISRINLHSPKPSYELFSDKRISSSDEYFKLLLSQVPTAQSFEDISKLIGEEGELDQSIPQLYPRASIPSSLGALSLVCLHLLGQSDPSSLNTFVFSESRFLLDAAVGDKEDTRDFSLLLLNQALESQDAKLKQLFLDNKAFERLLPLYRSHNTHVRLLVSSVCAGIYRNFSDAQTKFIQIKGESQLIQMIIRDGDLDSSLVLLLDNVLDLIYVTSKQIWDEIVVQNLRAVYDAHIVDAVISLNIPTRSQKIMSLIDNIMQALPVLDA